MTATDELKPCPFCGAKALVCEGGINGRLRIYGLVEHEDGCFFLADGLPMRNQHIMEQDFDAWNRRADDRIHCRDCRYYVRDKMPIDPDWPMMCYESGRDMLEPWGWCAWAERREDVNERDR